MTSHDAVRTCPICGQHPVTGSARICRHCLTAAVLRHTEAHRPVTITPDSAQHLANAVFEEQARHAKALEGTIRRQQAAIDELHDELYTKEMEIGDLKRTVDYERARSAGLQDQVDGLRELVNSNGHARHVIPAAAVEVHQTADGGFLQRIRRLLRTARAGV